ncbi:MAG: hypothetical protein HZC28_09285 [Spirochaetes bacterium]|nr:hypothetical protein [Spirochaetota bacterium]
MRSRRHSILTVSLLISLSWGLSAAEALTNKINASAAETNYYVQMLEEYADKHYSNAYEHALRVLSNTPPQNLMYLRAQSLSARIAADYLRQRDDSGIVIYYVGNILYGSGIGAITPFIFSDDISSSTVALTTLVGIGAGVAGSIFSTWDTSMPLYRSFAIEWYSMLPGIHAMTLVQSFFPDTWRRASLAVEVTSLAAGRIAGIFFSKADRRSPGFYALAASSFAWTMFIGHTLIDPYYDYTPFYVNQLVPLLAADAAAAACYMLYPSFPFTATRVGLVDVAGGVSAGIGGLVQLIFSLNMESRFYGMYYAAWALTGLAIGTLATMNMPPEDMTQFISRGNSHFFITPFVSAGTPGIHAAFSHTF